MRSLPAPRIVGPAPHQTKPNQITTTAGNTPQHFCQTIVENFEEMLRQADRGNVPLVMASRAISSDPGPSSSSQAISLHPHIMGYPFKVRALRSALAVIAKHKKEVWFTQPRHIYAHCCTQPPGVVP